MAGAGYDVSASTARSLSSGAAGSSDTFISFGNSSVSRGGSSQDLTAKSDASATTGSPGASNSFADLPVSGQYNLQQGINTQVSTKTLAILITAAVIIYLIKK